MVQTCHVKHHYFNITTLQCPCDILTIVIELLNQIKGSSVIKKLRVWVGVKYIEWNKTPNIFLNNRCCS